MARGRGLPGALPRRAWVLLLACVVVAAASLLVPPSLVTDRGVPFAVFFLAVTALQGLAALGVVAVVWYYRGGLGDDAGAAGAVDGGDEEWQYDP